MRFKRGRSRKSIAGIVATVIMFAILFTVGTSYFLFVDAQNQAYVRNLLSASNNAQGRSTESLTVTTVLLTSTGDIGFYVNDTSGLNANVTMDFLLTSSGSILTCAGKGLAAGSCTQQTSTFTVCTDSSCSTTQSPAPSFIEVNAGSGSPVVDLGYVPVSGATYVVKVATQLGNTYTQTYPQTSSQYANQAKTSGAITVNMDTFKWVHLVAQATSLVQTGFAQDCNSSICGTSFGNPVSAGNLLVYALGWSGNTPPSTPTDTVGSSFSLAASGSVTSTAVSPTMVQTAYNANCDSSSCGQSFGSNVAAGDILVYGLGWYKNTPPSTPTDSLGNSYSLAASKSVVAPGIPSLIQEGYNGDCASANCGQSFSSSVTANDVLAYAVSWDGQSSSPSLAGQSNEVYCNNASTCLAGKIKAVTAGDLLALSVGWSGQSAPTVTDTFGDTFVSGVSSSVVKGSTTYYSAVYYAIASTSADDTMQANFSGNANSAVTAYEVSGVGISGITTSTGSSTTATTTPQVTSFTPPSNSFVIAALQTTSSAGNFAQGTNYQIVGGPGPCGGGSTNACSEYDSSSSGAQTASWTLGNSVTYSEAAIAFQGIVGTTSQPSTPTDTLGNTFTLGASSSLAATPALPNSNKLSYCNNASSCQNKVNNVGTGDVVAVALSWYGVSAPTVTDTFGDTFVSGVSNYMTNGATNYYSAVYYATATSSGNDQVTVTYPSTTSSAMTLYDIWGVATSGISTSTGFSASGSTTPSVGSFTPTSGSFVIAALQTTSNAGNFAQGTNYQIVGGPGPCGSGPTDACSEYDQGSSGAQTASFTLGNSVPYSEAAIAFPPVQNYYNSYIWYANSAATGTDAISAHFSATVAGSVSVYEVAGVSANGLQSSTGSSATGPLTASVASFTPTSNAFVIGNVVAGGPPTYTPGTGYTQVSSNCSTNVGCSEYDNNVNTATTVQFGTNTNSWGEVAIAFQSSQITWYSYVWYATSAYSGADAISASFAATAEGSVSIYEVGGGTTAGLLTSNGTSSSGQTSLGVTAYSVTSDSLLVNNAETVGGETFTAGSGYTLSGSCSAVYGCGEYQAGVSGSHSGAMTVSPSSPYVEVSVDIAPKGVTYYSYVWTATAANSGTDAITASFTNNAAGTVSIYELNGYSSSSVSSSTGNSSASGTAASVALFDPTTQSFVVGNVESGYSTESFTAGTGYTSVGAGCASAYGCSEYLTSSSGSTTTPVTLGTSSPWVETAVAFSAPINPQSGVQVGGYPTIGVPTGAQIVFEATFTNTDPLQRSVLLWPQSVITVASIQNTGQSEQSNFFIIDSLNAAATTIVPYGTTTGNFITLPYNVPTVLYFGASLPQGNQTVAIDNNVDGPFYAFFSLSGLFTDYKLYGQTIPFPYGIITGANAYTTPTAGPSGSTVTLGCTQSKGSCGFDICPSQGQPGPGGPGNCQKSTGAKNAFVAWIDSYGTVTTLTTFRTTSTGTLPSNLQFTVPAGATPGYYTVMVSDYMNTVFMTFQVT